MPPCDAASKSESATTATRLIEQSGWQGAQGDMQRGTKRMKLTGQGFRQLEEQNETHA
jgi:hypothetical protein